jgi:hypothetical protein
MNKIKETIQKVKSESSIDNFTTNLEVEFKLIFKELFEQLGKIECVTDSQLMEIKKRFID